MLALASCSSESITDLNSGGNEIAFAVSTENASRAADVYCNNNLPDKFKVWASHESKLYINGDNVEYQVSKWVNTSGNRYWPSTGDVTFIATENVNGTFAFNPNPAVASTLTDFTVPTAVASQLDFIYARKTQAKAAGQVALNFRHALSQIVYKAKNTNPNLFVEIGAVSIVNVNSKADFAFPTDDTTPSYEDHYSTTDNTINNQGTWSNWETLATFPVSFGNKEVEGNTIVHLTSANDLGKEFSSLALLLLPQTTTAWAPGTTPKPTDEHANSYFVLSCKIRNVRGASVDADDVYLYGSSSDYASIYIPVAVNWAQGKKYVYTFSFGNGNGGYDDNGNPVLVPIDFTVTVDDFVLGGEQDVNMGTI